MNNLYSERRLIISAIFIVVGLIFLIRLFYIQALNDDYKADARNNVLRYVTQYPARGLIYDRNGEVLVHNEVAYDLMVIPRQVREMDTLHFCRLLGIEQEEFRTRIAKAKKYSWRKPSVFEKQISGDDDAPLQENLYKFPGFFVQPRTLRKYPRSIAAHVLGYISEVNDRIVKADPYYKPGDYIGSSGLEKVYEDELRGKKGIRIVLVDVHNQEKGSFLNGERDTLAVKGKDLMTTLDADLQEYGERLMNGKVGSIVAIEPASGEVLALVSSPGYDPNLLVGRIRSKNYSKLSKDSLNPLFNRALMAKYPPGSIFKTIQALIGQQENVISPGTMFACNKALVGCHDHQSPLTLMESVQHSCNPYYYNAFKRIINQDVLPNRFEDSRVGLDKWRKHVLSFGLGNKLGIDLPGENDGNVPTPGYYDRVYGKGRWHFNTIYSLSIGQGELQVIPLQMANLAAILANKGYYYTPHLIKAVDSNDSIPPEFTKRSYTTVSPEYYDLVMSGMQAVIEKPGGTARRARVEGLAICGKTGTAQNPHGEDHSVFIAFAPRESPRIAISVYVENAGAGGMWAAPIASLMIQQYLNDTISTPKREESILANKPPLF